MNDVRIVPLHHQKVFLNAIKLYDTIRYFWFIGGYRSGKSNTIAQEILRLAIQYEGQNVVIGVGSPTISLAKKTFLLDLEIILNKANIDYHFNRQENILEINKVRFIMIAISYPSDIYGYTFNAFLCDELDELPQHYGKEAFTAIDERCSQAFPDGRPPFCAFFSTAQGFKTIYTIIREFKSKKISYVLVRGRTQDNIHNHPDYYKSRYALYNENERLAFLEGHFVNLTTGRVYPEFNEEEALVDPFEIAPNEIIYVGQDKNIGYNKAVCIINRNKILYVIKTFSFQAISDAPRILRQTYPTNPIFWFPDVTAKEIIAGYANEIKSYGINLRVANVNPSVLNRIFLVNKIYKMKRSKVFRGCDEYCVALKTRCYDKNGLPEKGQGEHAPDHVCDSAEYVFWRVIMADNDFEDIRKLTLKTEIIN